MELAVLYDDENGALTWPVVDALPTPTLGLFVHHAVDKAGWMVTHHSGVGVAWWPEGAPEYAAKAAEELGPVTDWTCSGKHLAGIARSIGADVRRITGRWGGVIRGPVVREGVLT